jgi:hypothetical protein
MKKIILLVILITKTVAAKCDVIFALNPYRAYSFGFIYGNENVNTIKNTTVLWGGIGVVKSVFVTDITSYGLELGVEKRHYFQSEKYNHLFISAFINATYMTNFIYRHSGGNTIGITPGFKVNYKAYISKKTILEPYISLSFPLMIYSTDFVVFRIPMVTIGARFGMLKLRNDKKSAT